VQPDGVVRVVFALSSDDTTLKLWPHPFALRMTFLIGGALDMELEVRNPADAPFTYEEALHTYFAVGDVRQASVDGVENVDYIDKADGFKRKTQPAEPVRIAAETDRIYLNTRSACVVRDPVLKRAITVRKENSDTTVIWNPWIAKAKALPDFGDEEWPGMLCVETANAGDQAVRLPAGGTHRLRTRIEVSG
jgi:glucose-6-phosphate 1-epimerase